MRIMYLAVVGFALIMSQPVLAQSGEAGASNVAMQGLIDELKGLLDKGEKERLADPWYLRDLRDVIGRYDWPWRKQVLYDDFSAEGPTPNAPWTVTSGEFLIDWRYGLRSLVKPQTQVQAPPPQPPRQDTSTDDPMKQLLGGVLKQALGVKDPVKQEQAAPTAQETPKTVSAAVVASVAITNAFAIELELTSRAVDGNNDGSLEIGPYQGVNAVAGYRFVFIPSAKAGSPTLELVRRSPSGGSSTLELYDKPLDLADNKAHTMVWTRDSLGAMKITVDGATLIRVTDRSFRDPFDGITIVNSGGDYGIRRIKIDGAS